MTREDKCVFATAGSCAAFFFLYILKAVTAEGVKCKVPAWFDGHV